MKTPLSVLRNTLTIESTRKDGRWGPRVRLTKVMIKKWLGCSISTIDHAEAGERLSTANRDELVRQFGINPGWLDGSPKAPPVDWYGRPYTQATFDQRQRELKRQKSDRKFAAHTATIGLARCTALVGAILLRAFQQNDQDLYQFKIMDALRKIYFELDPGGTDRNGMVSKFIVGRHTITRPDLNQILNSWESHSKRILKS